jgi:hypothetical protein
VTSLYLIFLQKKQKRIIEINKKFNGTVTAADFLKDSLFSGNSVAP